MMSDDTQQKQEGQEADRARLHQGWQDTKKDTLAFVLCSIFYAVFIIGKMWACKAPQEYSFHDGLNTILVSLYPGFIFCILSAWVVCKTSGPVLDFTRKAVFRLAANCLMSVAGMLLIVAGSQFAINQYTFFLHHHIAFITKNYDKGQYMNCVFLSKDNQPASSVKIHVQNGLYDYQQQKFTFIDRNGIEYKTHVSIRPFSGTSFDSDTPYYQGVSLSFDHARETCNLTWIDPGTHQVIEKDGWFGWSIDPQDLGDWKLAKMMSDLENSPSKKRH